MLVARKVSCCVTNAFSTGLKVIWPRSGLKITKCPKTHFLQKVPGVNGLNCSCFCHRKNILLTELSRSVWKILTLVVGTHDFGQNPGDCYLAQTRLTKTLWFIYRKTWIRYWRGDFCVLNLLLFIFKQAKEGGGGRRKNTKPERS